MSKIDVAIMFYKQHLEDAQSHVRSYANAIRMLTLEKHGLAIGDTVEILGQRATITSAFGASEVGIECMRECGGTIKCWQLDRVRKV